MDCEVICQTMDVSLLICKDDNRKVVPIAPICELFKMDCESVSIKLLDDDLFGRALCRESVSMNGKSVVTTCLDLDYVPAWVFSDYVSTYSDMDDSDRLNQLRACCYGIYMRRIKGQSENVDESLVKENALLREQVEALKSISYHEGEIKRLKSRLSEIDQEIYNVRKKRHQVLEVSDD